MNFLTLKQIFLDEEEAIKYLIEQGIIQNKSCWRCKRQMIIDIKRKQYHCSRNSCRLSRSLFNHTFFSNTKIPVHILLWIAYMYLNKMPINGIKNTSSVHSEAITAWSQFIRQICADCVEFNDVVIGGPGIIVEIDETKLGKRKYHRGHRVDGVWVVAGVERTSNKRVFLIEVEDRSTETITAILKTHVLRGSIIYTDGWAPYKQACERAGLEHHVVNHRKHFKDPITGIHTNTIEGVNNGIKNLIKPRNRTRNNINDHLYYYIWRRQNKANIWQSFINALKEIFY